MAFKMNRPLIKGTPIHKASIAKAKAESIVAQTRTQADGSLVTAGNALGKSYIPAAIDFSIDQKAIKIPEGGEKKRKSKVDGVNPANKTGMVDVMINGVKTSVPAEDRFKYESVGRVKRKDTNKQKKVKEEKVKEEKADKEGTVISRLFGRARVAAEARKKQREEDNKLAKSKAAKQRLRKAEEDGGFDTENDYSYIENEPTSKQTKKKKYQSPDPDNEGDAMLERIARDREVNLNKAAKKYNVKPEDLEAKEIKGKKEYFPKQGVQGGFDRNLIPVIDEQTGNPKLDQDGEVVMRIDPEDKGTKWDDKLGRFKKAEATTGTVEEQQKAVEEMKPKYPQGMDPNLEAKGEIALNYKTNTYEYTNAYNSRIAREKIAAIEAERANTNVVTSEPVVEEKQTEKKGTGVIVNGKEVSESRLKKLDKAYEEAGPNNKKNYIEDGYVPKSEREAKSPMEMRDDRIYRNARADGPVRKNMIKSGYKPR